MSAVWPGAGTVIGYNAADLAMNFLIVSPLVDSYFGCLPPPAALDAGVLTGDPPLPRPTFQRVDERALQGMGFCAQPECGEASNTTLCMKLLYSSFL